MVILFRNILTLKSSKQGIRIVCGAVGLWYVCIYYKYLYYSFISNVDDLAEKKYWTLVHLMVQGDVRIT